MDIRSPNEGGVLQHTHPLILEHPETGRLGIFGGGAYIIGLEGVAKSEALRTLAELNAWQSTEVFVHKQKWEKNMLVMWDNRSVVHKATGGYEGYRRELHRVTVY
jgi:taurine dioxygenase